MLDKQILIHAGNKIKPNSFEAQSNKQFVLLLLFLLCIVLLWQCMNKRQFNISSDNNKLSFKHESLDAIQMRYFVGANAGNIACLKQLA